MAQSRSFSIYLLKQGYSADNSLKDESKLDAITMNDQLPHITLFISDNNEVQPWWKDYWHIEKNLKQVLKGAIAFVEVGGRCFAITFGHTYHNLLETCYEYDFGLRTTLNAVDPKKIKSTDTLTPESSKRERTQSSIASDLNFFDFNKDESIIKKLTGAVKEEYIELFSQISGSTSLKVNSKRPASEIHELCKELLEIYNKDDFESTFPDIQNIIPTKDPETISTLNKKLEEAFKENSIDLVLSIPEIIDFSKAYKIKYSGAGRDSHLYDDAYIFNYREYLERKNFDEPSITSFKKHQLEVRDENGVPKHTYPIFKCFIFDCEYNSLSYHLCEGEWYEIKKDYILNLEQELDPYFGEFDILTECTDIKEGDYNESIATLHGAICLDKKNIAPSGQTQIEPCDIFIIKDGIAALIHIKISTISSPLSHLFNQGLNSIEILLSHDEAPIKLKELLIDSTIHPPIDEQKYTVIYGIITAKNSMKKSKNIPIFSRISLLRTMKSLRLMRIPSKVVFIKDTVNRKKDRSLDSTEET